MKFFFVALFFFIKYIRWFISRYTELSGVHCLKVLVKWDISWKHYVQ